MEKREEEEEKEGEKIMGGLQSVASWLEWDATKKIRRNISKNVV